MDGIEDGTLKAVPQPADGVTLAPKITVEDAHVDWHAPRCGWTGSSAAARPRPVHGRSSGASGSSWSTCQPLPDRTDLAPGELVGRARTTSTSGTGSHAVELLWVQPQGKKPMRAADWARGVRIAPGEQLGAAGEYQQDGGQYCESIHSVQSMLPEGGRGAATRTAPRNGCYPVMRLRAPRMTRGPATAAASPRPSRPRPIAAMLMASMPWSCTWL